MPRRNKKNTLNATSSRKRGSSKNTGFRDKPLPRIGGSVKHQSSSLKGSYYDSDE